MKISKSLLIKKHNTLFYNKYKYKICLLSNFSSFFRNKKFWSDVHFNIQNYKFRNLSKIDQSEYNEFLELCKLLKSFDKQEIFSRVESPRLNIYTNNLSYIETLANNFESVVKFIHLADSSIVEPGVHLIKKLNYDYRVHLKTIKNKDHSNFLDWAKSNKNIRMTNQCIKDLAHSVSYGGSYFYVKDKKTLTLTIIFLGNSIGKIDRLIKA